MLRSARFIWLLLPVLMFACAEEAPPEPVQEATSLFGMPLYRPVPTGEQASALHENLAVAQEAYDANPNDADAIIWLGRRTAYQWRYQDAISIYTDGLSKHPEDARLYRHRGHRYISLRNFDAAIADYTRAVGLIEGTPDEIEPDGQPNAAGQPRSTLHTNIYYHLGLAHYLKGEFEQALDAYQKCLAASTNDDMYIATADWLYMTLRRLGRDEEAAAVLEPIHAEMDILENTSYLRRLLMYKGELTPDELMAVEEGEDADLTFATQGYGVGNWYLYNGDREQAQAIFERVVAGEYWAAFGYLAAEADLLRMQREVPA